jgi:hypothetical protein
MLTAAVLRYLDSIDLVVFGRAGADAFLERAAEEADDAVAIVSQPGRESRLDEYDWPDFQVICQSGPQPRSAYDRAMRIRDALNGLRYVVLADGTPDRVDVNWIIAKQSAPVNLQVSTAGMFRYSLGYRAEIRRATALRV